MAQESSLLLNELFSDLEKYLQCSICQEILTDPVTLTCGHSYCMKCLSRVLESSSKTCPECRGPITRGRDFNKSVTLCDIVKLFSDHRNFVSNAESTKEPSAEEVICNDYKECEVSQPQEFDENTASTSQICDQGNQASHLDQAVTKVEEADVGYASQEAVYDSSPLEENSIASEVSQDRTENFTSPLPGACFKCLTFDPTLGHGRLTFNNNKVATKGTSSAGHRDRFHITQWMALESFLEGIYFWDVDTSLSVGWAIGVAYDRIGRRDQLGRTLNSWCIEWSSRKETLSYWHNGLEEPLKNGNPCLVRVLLDLTSGSLYFYSLTDRQILLHCVQQVFSEPVRPAFWLYGLRPQNTLVFPKPAQ